jgi:hypothetical protein
MLLIRMLTLLLQEVVTEMSTKATCVVRLL